MFCAALQVVDVLSTRINVQIGEKKSCPMLLQLKNVKHLAIVCARRMSFQVDVVAIKGAARIPKKFGQVTHNQVLYFASCTFYLQYQSYNLILFILHTSSFIAFILQMYFIMRLMPVPPLALVR